MNRFSPRLCVKKHGRGLFLFCLLLISEAFFVIRLEKSKKTLTKRSLCVIIVKSEGGKPSKEIYAGVAELVDA